MSKPGEVARGLIIGAIYALIFAALKETPSYLNLSAAVRIAAFLALPPRRWATLVATDVTVTFGFASQAFAAAPVVQPMASYTIGWIIAASTFPSIGALLTAGIAHQAAVAMLPTDARQAIKLLVMIAVAAAVAAAAGLAIYSTQNIAPAAMDYSRWSLFRAYFMGVLGGTLVVVPLAGWLKSHYRPAPAEFLKALERDARKSQVWLVWTGLSVAALVIAAQFATTQEVLWELRYSMLVPPILCAVLFGWQGAIFSVAMVNVALGLTMTSGIKEHNVWQLLAFASVIAVVALFVGTISSRQRARSARDAAEIERWRDTAHSQRAIPEAARQNSQVLIEQLREVLRLAEQEVRDPNADRLEASRVRWSTLSLARQILKERGEMLDPPHLVDGGLRTALFCCPAIKTLRRNAVPLQLDLSCSMRHISRETQRFAYQMAHEAFAIAFRAGSVSFAQVRLRTGQVNGRHWIAVRIFVRLHSLLAETESPIKVQDQPVFSGLRRMAQAFGGDFRVRGGEVDRTFGSLIYDLGEQAIEIPPAATRSAG